MFSPHEKVALGDFEASVLLLVVASFLVTCSFLRRPFYAFIDTNGRVRIRLNAGQMARSFSEGLAAVSMDGRWGYIDSSGRFVIPPRFGSAEDFSEGLAKVTSHPAHEYWNRDTLFGFIDRSGQYVIEPRFKWALSFSDGLAPVCVGPCRNADLEKAQIGYIDHRGGFVVRPQLGGGYEFSEGLAGASLPAGIRPLHGFIDKSGRFVIAPRYVWTGKFSDGLAATDQGFVNHAGDLVIPNKHPSGGTEGFSGGWVAVYEDGSIRYYDTAGKLVLKTRFRAAGQFVENLAPACMSRCGPSESGSSWGYIHRNGEFAIRPRFGYRPEPFKNGLALVCFGCTG